MPLDTDKIDQAVLALLSLGRHEGYRAWKSFDWEVLGRLHQQGYIGDPVNKAKSVLFRGPRIRAPLGGVVCPNSRGYMMRIEMNRGRASDCRHS